MTRLGEYLLARSINQSEVARKAGLTKQRLNNLIINKSTHIRADELYRIALAINVNPGEMLEFVCKSSKEMKKGKAS